MTTRDLISFIADSCDNLNSQVPVYILYRDSNSGVIGKQQAMICTLVNGKIYIEASSIKEVDT